ncbi:unnamed protein product, partial [Durusdinium trenchii]
GQISALGVRSPLGFARGPAKMRARAGSGEHHGIKTAGKRTEEALKEVGDSMNEVFKDMKEQWSKFTRPSWFGGSSKEAHHPVRPGSSKEPTEVHAHPEDDATMRHHCAALERLVEMGLSPQAAKVAVRRLDSWLVSEDGRAEMAAAEAEASSAGEPILHERRVCVCGFRGCGDSGFPAPLGLQDEGSLGRTQVKKNSAAVPRAGAPGVACWRAGFPRGALSHAVAHGHLHKPSLKKAVTNDCEFVAFAFQLSLTVRVVASGATTLQGAGRNRLHPAFGPYVVLLTWCAGRFRSRSHDDWCGQQAGQHRSPRPCCPAAVRKAVFSRDR